MVQAAAKDKGKDKDKLKNSPHPMAYWIGETLFGPGAAKKHLHLQEG